MTARDSEATLQASNGRRIAGGALSTQLLVLDTGSVTLHCPAPGVEEHDLATTAGLQVLGHGSGSGSETGTD